MLGSDQDLLRSGGSHPGQKLARNSSKSCNIFGLLLGSKRPLARKVRKMSEKELPGVSALGSKTLEKRVRHDPFSSSLFRVLDSFSSLCQAFSTPGTRGARNPF